MNINEFKENLNLVTSLKKKKDYQSAVDQINKLLDASPHNPILLTQKYQLMSILNGIGDDKTVDFRENLLRSALLIDNGYFHARLELVYLLYVKNRNGESLDLAKESAFLFTRMLIELKLVEALVMHDQGDKEKAKAVYLEVEKLYGEDHEALLFSFRTDHPEVISLQD